MSMPEIKSGTNEERVIVVVVVTMISVLAECVAVHAEKWEGAVAGVPRSSSTCLVRMCSHMVKNSDEIQKTEASRCYQRRASSSA
jgi:hypothetical protein